VTPNTQTYAIQKAVRMSIFGHNSKFFEQIRVALVALATKNSMTKANLKNIKMPPGLDNLYPKKLSSLQLRDL